MKYTFKLRRGTAAEWVAINPVLREGEPGVELDSGLYKLGNGVSAWLELPYFITEEVSDAAIEQAVSIEAAARAEADDILSSDIVAESVARADADADILETAEASFVAHDGSLQVGSMVRVESLGPPVRLEHSPDPAGGGDGALWETISDGAFGTVAALDDFRLLELFITDVYRPASTTSPGSEIRLTLNAIASGYAWSIHQTGLGGTHSTTSESAGTYFVSGWYAGDGQIPGGLGRSSCRTLISSPVAEGAAVTMRSNFVTADSLARSGHAGGYVQAGPVSQLTVQGQHGNAVGRVLVRGVRR